MTEKWNKRERERNTQHDKEMNGDEVNKVGKKTRRANVGNTEDGREDERERHQETDVVGEEERERTKHS